ncbi:hypothetical protein IFO70_37340 [Phormidium tenue FACHB-886]|nr:hypothetical protein [Phormidium tenue FACHB-886]
MSLLFPRSKNTHFTAVQQVIHKVSQKMDEVASCSPNLSKIEYQQKVQEAIATDTLLQQMIDSLKLCQQRIEIKREDQGYYN